jgi:DNA replication protein DnaC
MKPLRIQVCPQPDRCAGYYIANNAPPDHPQAGQLLPCACTRRKQADQIKRELPPKLHTMTFESFEARPSNQAAYDSARQFAADPWGERYFLTLIGSNQRGKTHLAMAVVNALLAHGEPAYFETVPALLDELRGSYEDDRFWQCFDRTKSAPVLVLDDLGAESVGAAHDAVSPTWAQDKLYQIVDHRVLHELPTIYTTNLTRKLIAPRIAARLWNERYAVVRAIADDAPSTLAHRKETHDG